MTATLGVPSADLYVRSWMAADDDSGEARESDEQRDGEVVDADQLDDSPLPSMDLPLPKRRLWPLWLVLAAVLGGGGLLLWRELTSPLPLRVLVAIDIEGQWWEGSKPAAQVADELGALLDSMGFEPVRAGDPETAEVLEQSGSAEEAAHALRAAFIISGSITPEAVDLPIEGGFVEIHMDAPIRVTHLGDEAPLVEREIHTFSGAKTRDRAMGFAAESAARHAFDIALPVILAHSSVAELVEGKDPSVVDRLAPAKNFAAGRKGEIDGAAVAYAELDKRRLDKERAPVKPTFLSPPSAEDRLVAVGPDGWLVTTARVDPFYSARDMRLLRSEHLETVEWRGADGSKPPLWRGYNVFTYPSAGRAGAPVAVVEDLYGWARGLVLLRSGAAPKRVAVYTDRRVSEPKVAPGGGAIALSERRCVGCPVEIVVVDAEEGRELLRIDSSKGDRIGSYGWLDDEQLMVVFTPLSSWTEEATDEADTAEHGLWAIDVRTSKRRALLLVEGPAALVDPTASDDGQLAAVSHANGDAIATIEVASKALHAYPVGGRPSALSISPDGRRIAFELRLGGDLPEIAVLDRATGKVSRLTDNADSDRLPRFSADGKNVLFEARNTDPVFDGNRPVVRIASLPAPP